MVSGALQGHDLNATQYFCTEVHNRVSYLALSASYQQIGCYQIVQRHPDDDIASNISIARNVRRCTDRRLSPKAENV